MSIFASVARHEESGMNSAVFGKTSLSKETKEGLAEAKRKMIYKDFQLGEMHDGDLDDIVVRGQSVLAKEIKHARSIPGEERVFVRTDSSLFELQQSV